MVNILTYCCFQRIDESSSSSSNSSNSRSGILVSEIERLEDIVAEKKEEIESIKNGHSKLLAESKERDEIIDIQQVKYSYTL